jgi:hypothetical protein
MKHRTNRELEHRRIGDVQTEFNSGRPYRRSAALNAFSVTKNNGDPHAERTIRCTESPSKKKNISLSEIEREEPHPLQKRFPNASDQKNFWLAVSGTTSIGNNNDITNSTAEALASRARNHYGIHHFQTEL